jgi:hypothetical protein
MERTVDILMVTYNRPEYTRMSLEQLLGTCNDQMRVWIWHNGTHQPTLDVVRSFQSHRGFGRFHHSPENVDLRVPTNWLWANSRATYVSKVDDDCLMPNGWAEKLIKAHEDVPSFGVLGCWRFFDEDFIPELATRKIKEFPCGHRLLQNFWVEGSGYLMKRACIERYGIAKPEQSFSRYCVMLALKGWVNGWYYPFIPQEHMDDPRAPHSGLKTDADLKLHLPLSALKNGVQTLSEWQEQLRRSARNVQAASIDPRDYAGWRHQLARVRNKLKHMFVTKRYW